MQEEINKSARISAKELAKLMGISTRTLTRMDEDGTLPALHTSGGNRMYTSDHVRQALDIMSGSRAREIEVRFLKKGESLLRGRVEIPRRWLEKIGVNKENPMVKVFFDGEKIILSRPDRDDNDGDSQKVENDS